MDTLSVMLTAIVKFLDVLEIFLFVPIEDIIGNLFSYSGIGGTLPEVVVTCIGWFLQLFPVYELTMFQLVFGGGILIFLVYRFIMFVLPLFK